MLRFESPAFLSLLPVLLVLGGLAWWRLGRLAAKRRAVADEHLLPALGLPVEGIRRRQWRALTGVLALVLWTVALANPQFGTRTRLAAARNTELVIALDISRSMLATDVAPSRLDRARLFLTDLLAALGGERVGLLLFAGEAYLQMPLTNDYAAAVDVIRSANPGQAGTQGTNVAAALGLANRLLIRPADADAPYSPAGPLPPGRSSPTRRVVLVVSDGENHEPGALDAAETNAEAGVRTLAVGIGTSAGAPVPSTDPIDRGYERDEAGEAVTTRFDPAALQALAAAGEGEYYGLAGGTRATAEAVAAYLERANLGGDVEERFEERASYYQLCVGLGLLALGWAWWLGRRPGAAAALRATAAERQDRTPTKPRPAPQPLAEA